MRRWMLRAKIHRAVVTEVDLDYEGSLGVDAGLLELARLAPYERVEVYNITNGHRFNTYVIPLPPGSHRVSVYGAAAHRAEPGDRIIIAAYALLEPEEVAVHRPVIVQVDADNRVVPAGTSPPAAER